MYYGLYLKGQISMDFDNLIEVIEAIEIIDYTPLLSTISANSTLIVDFLRIICGGVVFFMVVLLCYFAYKFFRIFF